MRRPRRARPYRLVNNIFEADHGAFKRVNRPAQGFQTMKTAADMIKGFEVMRMIRRGHCLTSKSHVKDEVCFNQQTVRRLHDHCVT